MEDFEIRAQARYVWHSPRKMRLVVDRVRGMDALEALSVLRLMPHRAAEPVYKLVNSAVANVPKTTMGWLVRTFTSPKSRPTKGRCANGAGLALGVGSNQFVSDPRTSI